jgi:hypothetical protein
MRKRVFNTRRPSQAPAPLRFFGKTALLLTVFISLTLSALAGGPKQEFSKTINREFATNTNGMTALYNKYGAVNVKTWANNSVKIDITIRVNASSQNAADKMFDRIQVNFANTTGYVKAETMIQSKSGWWIEENVCQDFKINYDVWMPASNQLDLKNKYGNAYVAAITGKLMAEIKYGDLRTEALAGDADLNLSYGKAFIAGVNNLYGQVSYGEVNLTAAKGDVQMDTKYSELHLDKSNAVRLTSKYDDLKVGDIQDLRLQTKYSDVKAQRVGAAYITAQYTDLKLTALTTSADIDLCYGSLRVESLGREFADVNVVGKYTDVSIATERTARYKFKIDGSHTDISRPSGASLRRSEKSSGCETLEGHVGDANARGMVKAKMQYGSFVMR